MVCIFKILIVNFIGYYLSLDNYNDEYNFTFWIKELPVGHLTSWKNYEGVEIVHTPKSITSVDNIYKLVFPLIFR